MRDHGARDFAARLRRVAWRGHVPGFDPLAQLAQQIVAQFVAAGEEVTRDADGIRFGESLLRILLFDHDRKHRRRIDFGAVVEHAA